MKMKADEILEYLKKDVFPVYDGMTEAEMKTIATLNRDEKHDWY